MSTSLMPRSIALAKLLALGDMHHAELAVVCGWKPDEYREAINSARAAGLIRRAYRNHVIWFTVNGTAEGKNLPATVTTRSENLMQQLQSLP